MRIGLIGLGKMGYNLGLNMMEHGHTVVAYDVSEDARRRFEAEGGETRASLSDLADALTDTPRVFWVMVPAGAPVDEVLEALRASLRPGDIVIEGGNSHYKDSMRRAAALAEQGVHMLDVGTSGGMEGARHGACYMIGGDEAAFRHVEALFRDTAVENGYLYTGPSGSGHFAKMVHNGIEYGMMAAIGEGFEVLEKSPFPYDFRALARVWSHGSVIRGWLMELTERAFAKDPKLEGIRGVMHSSGEGRWTVEEALDLAVPTPVIALSLMMRYRSLQEDTFTGKVVAALRNEFGGHAVERAGQT
ncbi:MAG: decarboxylating 6-phosphogluconate dehydrogenase [Thermoflavifilum sp.]|nr:decarboxylating 6-phosphogluconate dehydrogenase [Thermoflavifilum sp.]MCL6513862.1 decarboxylating 6-phosphogluconate dehydrogenase [Alicyclobacillus sp.]